MKTKWIQGPALSLRRAQPSRKVEGLTLIEVMVSILVTAIISGAIASTFYVARNYYLSENQRVKNQQGASLFLLALEKTIRKASSAMVYDNFIDLNQVSPGTCIKLVDYNGTSTDFTDDITHWFYLSGTDVYWQVVPQDPKLLARNVSSLTLPLPLSFTRTNLYIQTSFQISGNPVLSYQTGATLRN